MRKKPRKLNRNRRKLTMNSSHFRSLFPNLCGALLVRVAHFLLRIRIMSFQEIPFYKFYTFYILKTSVLRFLRRSTFFYKVLQTACENTVFLHCSIISTLFVICRKYNMFVYSVLRLSDTCRTCIRETMTYMRETFFFWALPYRSGYAGVSVLDDLPRCRLPLVICNVAVHLTQLRSLTIPNADIGLSLLIGLSATHQTIIRYNCNILASLIFSQSLLVLRKSILFPSLLRLFSHCKGKTRPSRTAALCKVKPSGFG